MYMYCNNNATIKNGCEVSENTFEKFNEYQFESYETERRKENE